MTYAGRVATGTLLVLVATVVALIIAVEHSVRRDLEQDTRVDLEREAVLAAMALPADSLAWQPTVEDAAKRTGLRITVVDQTGRVRAESEVTEAELGRLENHLNRPEIVAALAGQPGADRRASATVGVPFMYVASPGGPGAVRVALSLEQIDQVVLAAQRPILVAGLIALLLGLPLAYLAARRVVRPLADIATAARRIASGESPEFPYAGIPDIDRLTADLHAMHDQLAERFDNLRRKQSETAAIVDSMVEGVLSSDAKGRITTANPAARRLLGYRDNEALPELPLIFRTKDARDLTDRALDGTAIADREIAWGDRTYLMNARPLPTGGAVIVLHDLTHLKRLEAVRRDFVANVSHELKTPLTAISGYAETLLADDTDGDTTRRFLETILSNARRMQRLVDDQLDLSRIESGTWTAAIEQVAIEPTAADAWAVAVSTTTRVPAFAVTLADDTQFISGDPEAVRQIFRNLFENAIRYTPPEGSVTVRAGRDGAGTRISVTDTGTGIPSDHVPRIFERFYRVDPSRSRAQGGTGLGLAIVKHLVENHGGRIWAESSLGRGTSIHVWWPQQLPFDSAQPPSDVT